MAKTPINREELFALVMEEVRSLKTSRKQTLAKRKVRLELLKIMRDLAVSAPAAEGDAKLTWAEKQKLIKREAAERAETS